MTLEQITKEWLEQEYITKERSFQDIAEEVHSYPNAIRRRAIKFNIQPRDKSAAQASALNSGRHKHPTKGLKRSEKVKLAISESVSKSWENLSDKDYESRVEKGRQHWESLSPEDRDRIQREAIKAVRKTTKEGSKLEKFLLNYLKNQGFVIEFHKKRLLANDALEVDMFLPGNNIAIEVDGPSHFIDVWQNGSLSKVQKADAEKNGLLLLYKVNVIRVKQVRRNLSDKNLRDAAIAVHDKIRHILQSQLSPDIHIVEVN